MTPFWVVRNRDGLYLESYEVTGRSLLFVWVEKPDTTTWKSYDQAGFLLECLEDGAGHERFTLERLETLA